MRDKERQEIDLRQLEEYERLFRQLAAVIDNFTKKISAPALDLNLSFP